MKLRVLGIICSCFILLAACGDKTAEKAIEQGKLALANKEYDKALASFSLALDEKSDEAKVLHTQTKKWMDAMKAKDEQKWDEANKLFEEVVETKGGISSLKEDAKKMKGELKSNKDTLDTYNNKLSQAQELINNKSLDEAKQLLSTVQQETATNEKLKDHNQKATQLMATVDMELTKIESEKKQKEAEEKKQAEEQKRAEEKKQVEEQKQVDIKSDEEAIPYVRKALEKYLAGNPLSKADIRIMPDSGMNTEQGYGGRIYENKETHITHIVDYHVKFNGSVTLMTTAGETYQY
ncbi:hypothetical protein ACWOMK_01720 [Bacillus thuringiensis]|uniref:hypothetical protein n=1 Tax=Bacillus TaxID=1386 RepID=UPI000941F445|nr:MULTISPECIES: hypothetical protein [Bacillus]PDY90833.1 hypothetical protein CON09_14920 [Bacillus anthracis]MDA1645130.1 hypothetical protein [Bacillus cereus group sp. TH163-1LC]MDA1793567.1 hypothetical protein [Bacillus cereus group sp. BY8-1LC]MDV5066860.1 hypothetical protein [Bacillus sp. W1]PEY26970.1 hypothetical protein CN340_12450 [Bacillus anthracis]